MVRGQYQKKTRKSRQFQKEKSSDAFSDQRKMIKQIRSNNEIKELLGEGDIIQTIKRRNINWVVQVWRSSDLTKNALNWKPEGKRSLGRPKKRWLDELNLYFGILRV